MFKIGDKVVCIYNLRPFTGYLDKWGIPPFLDITTGKEYEVLFYPGPMDSDDDSIGIKNDINKLGSYSSNRFISLKESRKRKLEKLELCSK